MAHARLLISGILALVASLALVNLSAGYAPMPALADPVLLDAQRTFIQDILSFTALSKPYIAYGDTILLAQDVLGQWCGADSEHPDAAVLCQSAQERPLRLGRRGLGGDKYYNIIRTPSAPMSLWDVSAHSSGPRACSPDRDYDGQVRCGPVADPDEVAEWLQLVKIDWNAQRIADDGERIRWGDVVILRSLLDDTNCTVNSGVFVCGQDEPGTPLYVFGHAEREICL